MVVIFQENVSFDHYFGTYPVATNTDGNMFTPAEGTPAVTGSTSRCSLQIRTCRTRSGLGSSVPGHLTCDQDDDYSDEEQAFDNFKMDHFVQSVGTDGGTKSLEGTLCDPKTESRKPRPSTSFQVRGPVGIPEAEAAAERVLVLAAPATLGQLVEL